MNFTYDVSESDFSYEEEGLSYSDPSDRDETTEQEQYDSQSHDSDAEGANRAANENAPAVTNDRPTALPSTAASRNTQTVNRSFPTFSNTIRNLPDGAASDTDTSSQVVESEDDRPAKRRCVAMDCGAVAGANASSSKVTTSTTKVSAVDQPSSSKHAVQSSQGEDGENCPICFEAWSNAGEHRLVSLRCGHLFGRSCIMRWLSNQGAKCPQCNRTAKKSDVRILYTKALRALDTAEREAAVRQLEEERERRQRAELDFAYIKLQFEFSQQECRRLRKELDDERRLRKFLLTGDAQASAQTPAQAQQSASGVGVNALSLPGRSSARNLFRFVPFRDVHICESGARVMAYTNQFATLVVSQPSNNQLYPGFGFRKLSLLDLCATVGSASTPATPSRVNNAYLAVHSKPIRDASFQPIMASRSQLNTSYVLLSGSVDKTVKLTSLNSNTVIQTYQCEHPVWSVCWSLENNNYFFAGLQNGALLLFDIRNTAQSVSHLNRLDLDSASNMLAAGSAAPSGAAGSVGSSWRPTNVVSMHYVEQSSQFRASGLLVGHLDRLVFYEHAPSGACDYVPHLLPVEQRALSSLSLEPTTGHFLASFRPNARCPTVQHQLYVLEKRSLSSLTATRGTESLAARRLPTAASAATPIALASTSTSLAAPTSTGSLNVSSCNHIATHNAGRSMTFLARNRLFLNPAKATSLLACASDEQSESIHVWDASDSDAHDSQMQRIDSSDGIVLDLMPIALPDGVGEQRSTSFCSRFLLAALTEKDVHMHQFAFYPDTV